VKCLVLLSMSAIVLPFTVRAQGDTETTAVPVADEAAQPETRAHWYDSLTVGAFADAYYMVDWNRPEVGVAAQRVGHRAYDASSGFNVAFAGLDLAYAGENVGRGHPAPLRAGRRPLAHRHRLRSDFPHEQPQGLFRPQAGLRELSAHRGPPDRPRSVRHHLRCRGLGELPERQLLAFRALLPDAALLPHGPSPHVRAERHDDHQGHRRERHQQRHREQLLAHGRRAARRRPFGHLPALRRVRHGLELRHGYRRPDRPGGPQRRRLAPLLRRGREPSARRLPPHRQRGLLAHARTAATATTSQAASASRVSTQSRTSSRSQPAWTSS
jgi:hypothetical protein